MYGLDGPASKKIKLEEPVPVQQPTLPPPPAAALQPPHGPGVPSSVPGVPANQPPPPPPPFYLTPDQMNMLKYLQQNQVSLSLCDDTIKM